MLPYFFCNLKRKKPTIPAVGQSDIYDIFSYRVDTNDDAAFNATFSLYHTAMLIICR